LKTDGTPHFATAGTAGTFLVAGLRAPVDVLIDTFGVPHIYAASADDLFRAQGFTVARERLFQMDLWRRRGLGRLAEVLGGRCVAHDRAARLFRYRGDMHAEWRSYGAGAERAVTAFVAGINAFIDVCAQDPALVPPEYVTLGWPLARWEPADVVMIRAHAFPQNAEQEVTRALTLHDFGAAVEDLRRIREPACPLGVPDGLDLAAFSGDVLQDYRLAISAAGPLLTGERQERPGSNNWVIGATRTATGRPLLANDPHRAVCLPSVRYLAHLSAPGLDVIGAGEPMLPGVSIGHNGHLAFGLTIFPIDQEDVYVYRTNPRAPDEYQYGRGWEPMRVVHETVKVAGSAPVKVELRFTRHGPVIHTNPVRHTAFALRAAWLEPGMAPYLGSLRYLRARTAEEFRAALSHWGAPGENHIYATPDGDIGWQPAGRVPIRPNWDGTLPVPGDGRYEWAGFLDTAELPAQCNPAEDWIATANEMNLSPGFLAQHSPVGYEWEHRFRYERIAEVLRDSAGFGVADCVRLQADTVDVAARLVLRELHGFRDALPEEEEPADGATEAAALLRAWDGDMAKDSAAAALYQLWLRHHLRPELLRWAVTDLAGPHAVEPALRVLMQDEVLGSDVRTDLVLLARLRADGQARTALLQSTLAAAWEEARDRLGTDPARWRWGQMHHAAPAHILRARPGWEGAALPQRERAGSGDTVLCTDFDETFRQVDGASFQIVVDVGDWDKSRAMNAPGQSGRPGSLHWDDLYEDWAVGRTFPLLYSREAVERHTNARLRLVPT
jgi:penicillin G amidase